MVCAMHVYLALQAVQTTLSDCGKWARKAPTLTQVQLAAAVNQPLKLHGSCCRGQEGTRCIAQQTTRAALASA
jgi:hypothetical protein